MSAHTDLADWCVHAGDIEYMTTKPLTWDVGYVGRAEPIVVPAGFYFDGTIPVFARPLISPHDPRFLKAFAIHDFTLDMGWDRQTSGGVFHAVLLANGAKSWERLIMFLVVTLIKWK